MQQNRVLSLATYRASLDVNGRQRHSPEPRTTDVDPTDGRVPPPGFAHLRDVGPDNHPAA